MCVIEASGVTTYFFRIYWSYEAELIEKFVDVMNWTEFEAFNTKLYNNGCIVYHLFVSSSFIIF